MHVRADPDMVLRAFDAGINFFFVTTDLHWPEYESLRVGLKRLLRRGGGIRDRVVVAGVTYVSDPKFAITSRRDLLWAFPELGHLDVLVVGGLKSADMMPRLHALQDAYAADPGARAIGASFHDRRAAATAHDRGLVDLAFVRHNPTHPGGLVDLFPRLREAAPALLFNFKSTYGYLEPRRWRALGLPKANWRPAFTDYYRFALSAPHMDGVLGSLETPAHLAAYRRALARGPLDEDEQRYLIGLGDLGAGRAQLAPG